MFKDLKDSWNKLKKESIYTSYGNGSSVYEVPGDLFEIFEKEFNICFIEQEDDLEFQSYKEN